MQFQFSSVCARYHKKMTHVKCEPPIGVKETHIRLQNGQWHLYTFITQIQIAKKKSNQLIQYSPNISA